MPNIELLHIDCMEYMKGLPDKAFELAIVDPEYGINASKGVWGSSNLGKVKDYGKKDWDKNPVREEVLTEILRVSKNQIIWGANHFISKIPFDSSCWIVWDKQNSGDFADCELAYTSFKSAVRKFTFRWNGMLQGDMKNKEDRIHPTQKPVALYKWLLHNYAKPGDKILDTHGGSMSSAIACHQMGFDLTLCELDKDYYEAGVKRFKEQTMQQSLFNPHQ